MKRSIQLIWLLLLLAAPTFARQAMMPAADEVPVINFVVWTYGGEKISYSLAQHPVVTHSGDKLILTTNLGTVEYAASDVRKFTFEPIYYFVAWLNDGSRYAYALGEHPVVTYSNGELLLTTQQQQVAYTATDVNKFTFSPSDITSEGQQPPTTGISTPQQPQLGIHNGDIHFSGSRAGSPINVYTLDGKLLHTTTTDDAGNATISIASHPAGVYIIKTETITHKIIKR